MGPEGQGGRSSCARASWRSTGSSSGDINWLDELYDLSVKLPPAEQAIIEQATFMSRPGRRRPDCLGGPRPRSVRDRSPGDGAAATSVTRWWGRAANSTSTKTSTAGDSKKRS